MIVVMKTGAPTDVIEELATEFEGWGLTPEKIVGTHKIVIGLVGDTASLDEARIQELSPFIEQVLRVEKPYKRASLEFHNGESTTVTVATPNGPVHFGRSHPLVVMAGPCSVENEAMIVATAKSVGASGAKLLRGGAYKPRTSPYSFQGHGESALELLEAARAASGLGIITEVMDTADIDRIAAVADILQVGARNMQNFALLKQVGQQSKPVMVKRGPSATIDEWLMAAEYVLAAGNPNVILCERGIRTFDSKYTRNTLDLSAVPVLQSLTHLPIVIDPSHGTGKSQFVPATSKAAVALNVDSLMIEVHPDPSKALSDGPQSLTFSAFSTLMDELEPVARIVGRDYA
ncbi:3-deoxy-7-phosphoheptulonate synthase [Synechococcus sp. PCC 7336]|uniref:3-deoxy-7-phosphoheptulonate synthase n=1 Tax=Synechococcus sp. PCC 7336 TaxID=195250 RepID=UPI00034A3B53|nr:3-deoxy-7-phosphoheptulonate synthase [Synechococcus sp. PCC 7336]